jgi:DNA repair protein RecN (Recombination protein N)
MPLTTLTIEQLGLFEAVSLHLPTRGYHALLGETGAGKSLLLSSLQWLFGATISPKEALRQGATQGKVEACFQLPYHQSEQVHRLCLSQGIDLEDPTPEQDSEVWLSREFSAMASRYRINGCLVSKAFIEQLAPYFMEFQSQHSHVQLLKPSQQRLALDALGGQEQQQHLAAVERLYTQWSERHASLLEWQSQRQQLEQKLHLLNTQVEELQSLQLTHSDEDEQLIQERSRLESVEALQQVYQMTQTLLMDGYDVGDGGYAPSAREQLQTVERHLRQLQDKEVSFVGFCQRLEQALAIIEDVAHEAQSQADSLEANPQRLEDIQHRLASLKKVKRLYGPSLAEVMAYQERIEAELAEWQSHEQSPQALEQQVARLAQQLQQVLDGLSEQRRRLAQLLEARLRPLLEQLMLPHAVFEARLLPRPPHERFHPHGQEDVTFYFSANPGEPAKALGKVASGGELARLLLALVVATESLGDSQRQTQGRTSACRLFVFDELDTGTSGEVAKAIARLYQQLGQSHQVLAITHQALVAANGEQVVFVSKEVYTDVDSLGDAAAELGSSPTGARTRSVVRTISDEAERLQLISSLALGETTHTIEGHAGFAHLLKQTLEQEPVSHPI